MVNGCAPCEARQAAMLSWANGDGGKRILLIVLGALALFTLWPHLTRR